MGGPAPRAAGAAARCRAAGPGPGRPGQRQPGRPKRGEATDPNPTDRGRPGTRRHLAVDGRGTPLGVALSGANWYGSKLLAATLDAAPPVRSGKRGRPRRRPAKLHAGKSRDHRRRRRECRERGIEPQIARRGVDGSKRLDWCRRIVEHTLARQAQSRRLAARRERRAEIYLALTTLACALVCLRQLRRFYP